LDYDRYHLTHLNNIIFRPRPRRPQYLERLALSTLNEQLLVRTAPPPPSERLIVTRINCYAIAHSIISYMIKARLTYLFIFFFIPLNANAQSSDIEVRFAWEDTRECLECTIARLRLAVDDTTVFASSVMLQNYSDLDSPHNRAIKIDSSGSLKCKNHTQDKSAPDSILWGVNFQLCVGLLSRSKNEITLEYLQKISKPYKFNAFNEITYATFRIKIVSSSLCSATLLGAEARYADKPTVEFPLTAVREQTCYFVTAG
jgi:hypothetical protein